MRGKVIVAAVMLLTAVCAAEETEWEKAIKDKLSKRVSFEFVDTQISEAVGFLQNLTKVNFILDQQVWEGQKEPVITLKVEKALLSEAMAALEKAAGYEHVVMDGAYFISTPKRVEEFRYMWNEVPVMLRDHPDFPAVKKSDKPRTPEELQNIDTFVLVEMSRNVSFEFVDSPISEAIQFLQSLTKVSSVGDPKAFAEIGADKKVTLRVTDMPSFFATRWILRFGGLDIMLGSEALSFSSRERILELADRFDPLPPPLGTGRPSGAKTEWEEKLDEALKKNVSFEFVDTPLSEAIQFLQNLVKANVILDPQAGNPKVTLTSRDIPLGDALKKLEDASGLTHTVMDGAYFISTRERVEEFSEMWRGIPCDRDALKKDWAKRPYGWMKREGSYDFVETPMTEAMQFSQALTYMNIVFDPVALEELVDKPMITFHLYDLPAIFAYRWIVRLSGLELGLRYDDPGSVLISSPDTIVQRSADWLPLPLPLQLDNRPPEFKPKWVWQYQIALRKKVSYDFKDVEIRNALEYLQEKTGLKLVIDPDAAAAKKDVRITLPNATESLLRVLKRIEEASGLMHSLSDNAYRIILPVQKEAPVVAQ